MDLTQFFAAYPTLAPIAGYVTLAVTVASVVATALPPPSPGGPKAYLAIYTAINWVALTFGHARNVAAPGSPPSTVTATAPTAPIVVSAATPAAVGADLSAALAVLGAAHAATPAGAQTTSTVANGVATTTTTVPLAGVDASESVKWAAATAARAGAYQPVDHGAEAARLTAIPVPNVGGTTT